ncbi:D-alanyl-D-alanine carboxypeptidase/D-alanyl-D-alanine-endopeptidase [Kitasatospora sp. MBT63]|uniref:D-alanyl-D-alanine carboxypeptidase/D-alanyl-D-alanine endopeptidase n=1 Tax=Kitasatospora sp. MBT63 TaxID=1444768 RepID=UPI0007C68D81|nr:D-alanyl-D-alanine carboxypeptidase/D-alanyl-D-alanine-endopeptidase [Kitasatospora sp. MBT63]
MRTTPFAAVLVGALLLTSAAARTEAATPPGAVRSAGSLGPDLDRLFADARLTGAQSSALVTDAATGEVLYEHAPGALLLPASTLKTVTAAAALDLLGPDHRFTTEVRAAGRRSGPALDGDLVLHGGGDPTLLPADLDALAGEVAAAGITEVTGALRADVTRYDDVPLGADWAWDDQAAYYSPQISALTLTTDTDYDPGTVRLTLTPAARPGQPAQVEVTPAEAPVHLSGSVTTAAAGGAYTVQVDRRPGGNELRLDGALPADGGTGQEWIAVDDPAALATTVFAAALARHGVTVRGGAATGRAPEADTVLARHDSAPLADLMVPFLKLSNNGIAEHLVKEIGRVAAGHGSWAAGLDRIAGFLHRSGLEPTAARQRDGSGLSRRNLLTTRRLTALFGYARTQPWFHAWYDALPVAGDPRRMVGGTLTNRMRGTAAAGRVHAKTGSMTGVDALAGYVERADGRTLAFAVLLNNFAGDSPRPLLDAFAVRLAGDGAAGPAPADRAPDSAAPSVRDGRRAAPYDWETACLTDARC